MDNDVSYVLITTRWQFMDGEAGDGGGEVRRRGGKGMIIVIKVIRK